MHGNPAEVSNELSSHNDPEAIEHVEIIAALCNALNRIAALEKKVKDLESFLYPTPSGSVPLY
jgi:hypothetical protein